MISYTPDDLIVRRLALGLTTSALAPLVGRTQGNISDAEKGRRPVTSELMNRVAAVERWSAHHHEQLVAGALKRATVDGGEVVLERLTEEQFRRTYPTAGTTHGPIPVVLHDLALGRVAAELEQAGVVVRVVIA